MNNVFHQRDRAQKAMTLLFLWGGGVQIFLRWVQTFLGGGTKKSRGEHRAHSHHHVFFAQSCKLTAP